MTDTQVAQLRLAPAFSSAEELTEQAAQALRERSERFVPAFARLTEDPMQPGRYNPLDISWNEQLFIQGGSEELLQRYICLKTKGWVAVDGDNEDRYSVIEAFAGPAMVGITPTRLIGIMLEGESVLGEVDGHQGVILVFSVRLRDVAQIRLVRERKLTGLKDRGIGVIATDGLLVLDFDKLVDDAKVAHRIKYADVLRTILTSTCGAMLDAGIASEDQLASMMSAPSHEGDDGIMNLPYQPGAVSSALFGPLT